jgi:hypothetical protein
MSQFERLTPAPVCCKIKEYRDRFGECARVASV